MDEAMLAEIKLFAGNFAPANWAFCQGQTLQIASNTALYSLLGVSYGGNGQTTFNLPDITPLPVLGTDSTPLNYIICVQGLYPMRS